MSKPKIYVIANPRKAAAVASYERLVAGLSNLAVLTGEYLQEDLQNIGEIDADYVISLGGDGTMLAVGRALGRQAIPIIGVNLGKLGYLAEYSVDELIDNFQRVVTTPELIGERMVLEARVICAHNDEAFNSLAINDVCIIAGQPFRMIEMEIRIGGKSVTQVRGDGLIFSTPTGSTAYNMSVGGPIILPKVKAIVISPIAPQSLSFRPLVVDSESHLTLDMVEVNQGTELVVDGQLSSSLAAGDVIQLRRYQQDCRIVRHIDSSPWTTLVTKLGWAQSPRYNDSETH